MPINKSYLTKTIIFIVTEAAVIAGIIFWWTFWNNNFGKVTDGEIPVMANFKNKIVYTSDRAFNSEFLERDCELKKGVFDECGSVCFDDNADCEETCAYTCDLTGGNHQDGLLTNYMQ